MTVNQEGGSSGHATNRKGIEWLQETLGPDYTVHTIELRDDVLHLDCAMVLLNDTLGVICEDYIKSELPESFIGRTWVKATAAEAQVMGTNGMVIDSSTVIMDNHHGIIASALRDHGHTVVELPYEAGTSFGGGMRCSHHRSPLKLQT